MRFGGWTRLGIIISVLYGVLVVFVAYDGRPRLEYMQSAWFKDASDVIAEAISKKEGTEVRSYEIQTALLEKGESGNIAWLEKVVASPSEDQKIFSSAISQVNSKHRALIANFPQRQREYWLLAFAWWAGGTFLLFTAGWTVRWVLQGFRRDAV